MLRIFQLVSQVLDSVSQIQYVLNLVLGIFELLFTIVELLRNRFIARLLELVRCLLQFTLAVSELGLERFSFLCAGAFILGHCQALGSVI